LLRRKKFLLEDFRDDSGTLWYRFNFEVVADALAEYARVRPQRRARRGATKACADRHTSPAANAPADVGFAQAIAQKPQPLIEVQRFLLETPDITPQRLAQQSCCALTLKDGSNLEVGEALIERLIGIYPLVDVRSELRNMQGW